MTESKPLGPRQKRALEVILGWEKSESHWGSGDLAKALGLSRPQAVHTLVALRARRLIVPAMRRALGLVLTPEGEMEARR